MELRPWWVPVSIQSSRGVNSGVEVHLGLATMEAAMQAGTGIRY